MPTREELLSAVKSKRRDEMIAAVKAQRESSPREPGVLDSGGSGQAALESFGNAATLGYLPHIQAATEKPMSKLLDLITGGNVAEGDASSYLQRRDQNIARQASLSEANPKASIAGTIGGIGATALGGGLIGGIAKGASGAAKAAQAAKAGAVLGGIANPGDTAGEIDPLQFDDRGKNAAIGGALGVAAEGLASLIGAGAKKGSEYLGRQAERRAFKALGPYQKDALKAYNKGEIESIGREVLDAGVVGGKNASYEELALRAGAAKDVAGKKIGKIIDSLGDVEDSIVGKPGSLVMKDSVVPTAGLNRGSISDSLDGELLKDTGVPGLSGEREQLSSWINEFRTGGGPIGIREAQKLKTGIGDQVNWKRPSIDDIPLKEQFYRSLYSKVNKGVDDASDVLAGIKGPETTQNLGAAKKTYGAMSRAENIANTREGKEFANRLISPSDYLTGGIGAAGGFASGGSIEEKLKNAALGASLGLVNKGARKYGNQMAAKGFDAVSRRLGSVPKVAQLADSNPIGYQALVQSMVGKLGQSAETPIRIPANDQGRVMSDEVKPDNAISRRMSR